MKILLYCLQSSGGSLVAFNLSQRPGTFSIVDLFNHELCPSFDDVTSETIVVKCVITSKYSLVDHVKSFKPEKTILVLRNPYHNYVSLMKYDYANESGTIDEKFRILEETFKQRERFTHVIHYEDFIKDPSAPFSKVYGRNARPIMRGTAELLEYNKSKSGWCRRYHGLKWGLGNISKNNLKISYAGVFKFTSPSEKRKIRRLCPELAGYYDKEYRWGKKLRIIQLVWLTAWFIALPIRVVLYPKEALKRFTGIFLS